MVRKGTHLRVVQEALGHSSLQTASVYVSLARDLMDQRSKLMPCDRWRGVFNIRYPNPVPHGTWLWRMAQREGARSFDRDAHQGRLVLGEQHLRGKHGF